MINKIKVKQFIETLNDEELYEQIEDLNAFVEEYYLLLKEEQNRRNYKLSPTESVSYDTFDDETDESLECSSASLLKYDIIAAIKEKVLSFSDDVLIEQMMKIDEILQNIPEDMPLEIIEQYSVAKEMCELSYFERFHKEPQKCNHCRAYIYPSQIYCWKCGSKL